MTTAGYSEERLATFAPVYAQALGEVYAANPRAFLYPASKVPEVAARVVDLVREQGVGAVTYNSPAFKRAAKALGVEGTRKSWIEWLRGPA